MENLLCGFSGRTFLQLELGSFGLSTKGTKLKTQNKLNPSPAKNYDVRNQFLGKLFDNGF